MGIFTPTPARVLYTQKPCTSSSLCQSQTQQQEGPEGILHSLSKQAVQQSGGSSFTGIVNPQHSLCQYSLCPSPDPRQPIQAPWKASLSLCKGCWVMVPHSLSISTLTQRKLLIWLLLRISASLLSRSSVPTICQCHLLWKPNPP